MIFQIFILILNLYFVKTSYIEQIKSSEITIGHESCRVQFKSFVESLKVGEKWANDSKYL